MFDTLLMVVGMVMPLGLRQTVHLDMSIGVLCAGCLQVLTAEHISNMCCSLDMLLVYSHAARGSWASAVLKRWRD
jgi:hypothetical protein